MTPKPVARRCVVRELNGHKEANIHERSGVSIELFGVLRVLTGRERLPTQARTVRQALEDLVEACPELVPHYFDETAAPVHCCVLLNGRVVLNNLDVPLKQGDTLQVTTLDVGG